MATPPQIDFVEADKGRNVYAAGGSSSWCLFLPAHKPLRLLGCTSCWRDREGEAVAKEVQHGRFQEEAQEQRRPDRRLSPIRHDSEALGPPQPRGTLPGGDGCGWTGRRTSCLPEPVHRSQGRFPGLGGSAQELHETDQRGAEPCDHPGRFVDEGQGLGVLHPF